MRNKKLLLSFAFIFLALICFAVPSFAKDLDEIQKYYVTVDTRKDGTLDMTYYFEWKVLDSVSEGPLEWVKIGVPNSHVDTIKALTKNIAKIEYTSLGGDYIRIDLDAENYREKRKETLKNLASKKAYEAVKYNKNITLEPMNAYERRIIHMALQENDKVTTYSIGEEPYRKIVIKKA